MKGEKHAVLWTSKGPKRANFCGPGTQLEKRLKRGDKPVSNSDAICLRHDLAYSKATSYEDERIADENMLQEMEQDPTIWGAEKWVMGGLIRSKMSAQKIAPGTFSFADISAPQSENAHPLIGNPAPLRLPQNQSFRARRKRANLTHILQELPPLY